MNNNQRTAARAASVAVPAVLLFIGIIFVAVAVVMFTVDSKQKTACSETAEATVVKMVQSSSSSGTAPVFSFTADGKEYQVQENVYSSPPQFSVGDTVTIHYNPDKPSQLYSEGIDVLKILYLIFGIIGGTMVVIPIGMIVLAFILTRPRKNDEFSQYNM